MNRWKVLLVWMAFVAVVTFVATAVFGERAHLTSTGYVVMGTVVFVTVFIVRYWQFVKRNGKS